MFNTALAANVDTITDFDPVNDLVDLAHAVFTTLPTGALSASAFFAGPAAHDADDRIIYDSSTGKLFYDADGNGAGAQVQFATLSTGLAVTEHDFFVI